jgi:hypothetical protein
MSSMKRTYVGVRRIVPSPPTQPLIGAVQHVVGGELREDRHAREMMTEIGNDKNAAVEPSPTLLQCISPVLALSGGS